ncbi:MAG TPA: sensor domain-containing protein, partial [Acidimicrobiales bacterium]
MTGPTRTLPPPPPPPRAAGAVAGPSVVPATAPSAGLARRLLRPLVAASTWKATAHLLLNLAFGIVWFTLIVTGFSFGLGSLITLIGIPILLLVLLFARVISAVERARVGLFLDARVGSPFRPLGGPGSIWQQIKALISDGAAWKALAFGIVALPLGIVSFTVTVVLWSVGLAGATFPLYGWFLGTGDQGGLNLSAGERAPMIVVTGIVGAAVLIATPFVVRGMAVVNRNLVRGLCGPSGAAELQHRVEELSESREASVDAAEA